MVGVLTYGDSIQNYVDCKTVEFRLFNSTNIPYTTFIPMVRTWCTGGRVISSVPVVVTTVGTTIISIATAPLPLLRLPSRRASLAIICSVGPYNFTVVGSATLRLMVSVEPC